MKLNGQQFYQLKHDCTAAYIELVKMAVPDESRGLLLFTQLIGYDILEKKQRKEQEMEEIRLEVMEKDGQQTLKELTEGKMVVARSRNDFLYMLDFNGEYHMFSHTPGAPGGGQKRFPKDEKYTTAVRKIADMSDSMYLVEFDKGMNIYGVMVSAEEGILSMFPGTDRDSDADVEFIIPERKKTEGK